jgi:hypothetical protein
MSYSFNRKCGGCKEKVACMDSSFIKAAIEGIHQANYNDAQRQVHLGAGTIVLDCCNFKDEKEIQDVEEESIFKRNDVISTDNKTMHTCICADVDIAVFAPMDYDEEEKSNVTHYENMFVVGNLPSIIGGFVYERITFNVEVKE